MRSLLPLALAVLSIPGETLADEPAPGFEIEVLPNGGPTYLTTTLSSGEFVGIGNQTIAHFEQDGTLIQVLHTFPDWIPPYGIAVDPTETFVLACRSDGVFGGTYRVDLSGGPATFVSFLTSGTILFESQDSVLMNVADGFFGWWVYRMDLNTGSFTTKSATFSSVIAPVALDAAGNLYMAHEPSMAGTVWIERFDADQVAGPGLLSPGSGRLLHEQAIQIYALAITPDGSAIYACEDSFPLEERIFELRDGSRRELAQVSLPQTVFHLQLRSATKPGHYPFNQPALAGELIYVTYDSDWKRKVITRTRQVYSER